MHLGLTIMTLRTWLRIAHFDFLIKKISCGRLLPYRSSFFSARTTFLLFLGTSCDKKIDYFCMICNWASNTDLHCLQRGLKPSFLDLSLLNLSWLRLRPHVIQSFIVDFNFCPQFYAFRGFPQFDGVAIA